MTGSELEPLDGFIETTLAGDAALTALLGGPRVYVDLAPQGITGPVVVFAFISGTDTPTVGAGARIKTELTYLVKAVTRENGYAQAHPIARRIDQLLLGASGQLPAENLFVLGTVGIEPIRYPELVGTVRYGHLGRRYRFICSAIS